MVTYLGKNLNDIIHRNKKFTLTYLNAKGKNRTIKTQKDLFSFCSSLMSEKCLMENGLVERYSIDIDSSCRYAWGFNVKKALFFVINNAEQFGITLVQATYNKTQIYSIKNENLKLEELDNIKMQRDVYKKQVEIQKGIIKLYQDDEDEELEV